MRGLALTAVVAVAVAVGGQLAFSQGWIVSVAYPLAASCENVVDEVLTSAGGQARLGADALAEAPVTRGL